MWIFLSIALRYPKTVSNPSRLRAEHEALFHSSLMGAAYVSDGHFVRVNEEFARILGRRAAELAGAAAGDFAADPRPDGPPHSSYQREHVRPDGDRRLLLIEETPIEGEHRSPGRLVTVVDITDRQRHAAELEIARALLLRAVNSMSDGFVLFDADDRILLCNQVYTSMLEGAGAEGAFGSAESMTGMHVETIIRRQIEQGQPMPSEYAGDIERWVRDRVAQHRKADGQPHLQKLAGGRWVQSIRHRTPDGGIVVLRSDITALKRSEQAAQELAHHDPLTGLPNRRLLYDRLERSLARAQRATAIVGVLLVDLDAFKPVNDTYGHETGDEVLRATAERLKGCLRTADTVARFGGDEFVVVLDGLASPGDVAAVAGKIIDAVGRPIPLPSAAAPLVVVRIGCSIGVAMYPQDGADADTLIRLADAAMYQAKESGRGRFMYHAPPA
jgi:diguanylate cyclase (GGDEF)-like protein/PAS domain S-box-containing protein